MLHRIGRHELSQMNANARAELIIVRVRDAQVAGLGGGKFPTATKLTLARTAQDLIINGMQSEPDNNSDVALLQEDPAATVAGVGLVALVCPAETITLALPAGMDKALTNSVHQALQTELDWLNEFGDISRKARQVYLRPDHAAGEEHKLATLLGIIDCDADLDVDVDRHENLSTQPLTERGVLCLNIATCHAIGRAVYNGEPLSRRMVTLNGDAQWIDFGTPIAQLLSPAWVNGRHGGGKNTDQSVDAGTFCITDPAPNPDAPCINCAACRPVCPSTLLPDEIYRASLNGRVAAQLNLDACIECGACNAVCPSGLHLTQQFRAAKYTAKKAHQAKSAAAKAKARVKAREQRIERNQKERDEHRTKRLQTRTEARNRSW